MNKTITGLYTINANDIYCETIQSSTVSNYAFNTLIDINTNTTIQQQINSLNSGQSIVGPTGPSGMNGMNGSIGSTGPTGPIGVQGPKGDKGDNGTTADTAQIIANTTAIAVLGVSVASNTVDITTLQGEMIGVQEQIGAIDEEISALNGKTQYQTCNGVDTTGFLSNLNIGNSNNPTRIQLDRLSGNITTNGNISSNQLNTTNLLTGATGNQYIYGSSLVIGNPTNSSTIQMSGASITIGQIGINPVNLNGIVYINGTALIPFSSASSFFSQW